MKKEMLKKMWVVARFIIGFGLIVFLLWRLDISKIYTFISGVEITHIFAGLSVYVLFIVFSAWRWQILLNFKRFEMRFGRTLMIYFIAMFFNNLLPTTIGGDVMRVFYSMHGRRADALAIVLVDRILGFVGLFVFALFAVLYLLIVKNQTEFLPFILIGLAVVLMITYVFFSGKAYTRLSPVIGKVRIFQLGDRINKLHKAATDFGGAWGPISLCITLSIAIQALLAVAPYIIMRGMGITHVGLLPFLIYLPIINVVCMIPISFNALGIREYFYVILFSRAGLAGETAVAVSLVSLFLTIPLSVIGGIFFAFSKRHG